MTIVKTKPVRNIKITAEDSLNNNRDLYLINNKKTACECLLSSGYLAQIARHLSALLRAGMPIVPALSALVEQFSQSKSATGKDIAKTLSNIRQNVNEGDTLAAALAKFPNHFPTLFINMVLAGQTAGNLEEILMRLAVTYERKVQVGGKVKAAIAYPVMMMIVAFCVVVFLMSVVVPNITQMFIDMDQELPLPTRLLIGISEFLQQHIYIVLIGFCGACFGIFAGITTKRGRVISDTIKLKIPLLGQLFLKLEIARLTRTLGALIASGIHILDALAIACQVSNNSIIAGALEKVKDSVANGNNVADAMRQRQIFPPVVTHIIATGQASGTLEQGLNEIADMYENEIDVNTKMLTSLLEPVILLVMGVIIGFIVMAILLPIFKINQNI